MKQGLLNLRASEPCEPCEPFLRVFFFSSIGLRGRGLFHQETSRARLSLNYRYKPLARHLESRDDPGDEYKRYNLAPRVLSFPGKLILNKFSYKSAEN